MTTKQQDSYEAIVLFKGGRRQQIHFREPHRVGDTIHDAVLGKGRVVELVCEGCWAHPCICKPDDCPCDPE